MRFRAPALLVTVAAARQCAAPTCQIASRQYSQCFEGGGSNVAGWTPWRQSGQPGNSTYSCCPSACPAGCLEIENMGGSGTVGAQSLRGLYYDGSDNQANVFTTVVYSDSMNFGDNGIAGNGVMLLKLRPLRTLQWHYVDYFYVNENNLKMYSNGVHETICTNCMPTGRWITIEILLDAPTYDQFRVCVDGVKQGADYTVQTSGHDGIYTVDLGAGRGDVTVYYKSAVWSTRQDTVGCTTCSSVPDTPCPASPTAAPILQPSRVPSVRPTFVPSTSPPTVEPTGPPTAPPTLHPSLTPTFSPARPPTPSPTRSPSPTGLPPSNPPTLIATPSSSCTAAADGVDCASDATNVTLDICRGGRCVHVAAAAAFTLTLHDSADDGYNISTPDEYIELGALDKVGSSECDGPLGVSIAGRAVSVIRETLPALFTVASYRLSYDQLDTPARLVVGWRLEGQAADGSEWNPLDEVTASSVDSHTLLEEHTVRRPAAAVVRSVQVKVTTIRGDVRYSCSSLGPILAAAGAAAVVGFGTLAWVVFASGVAALCGVGVLALREAAREPDVDAPWMGTKDFVEAKVLECYEALEEHWTAKESNVLAEAAADLVVRGADALGVLAAHGQAPWTGDCSDLPQLRRLPRVALELLRRYSHEAQDTDHICGLPGAPKPFASYKASDPHHPKEAKAAWQGYKAQCCKDTGKPSINPALYADLNRAAREAAEGGSAAPEAWAKLTPILKQACLLIAAAAHASDPPLPPRRSKLPCPAGPAREQRWLRMLSLPDVVRDRFAGLRPGMCIAWSVGVASVTCNAKASSDFMYGGAGRCVLVRMTAPQSDARALSLGPASLYGGEGELLVALGTMFRVRNVSKGRMLTRYIQPTAATPVTARHLIDAIRNPLLIVDVEWLQSPQQWCDAARALCNDAMRDAWAVEDAYVQQKVFNFKDVAALCPGLCSTESPLVSTKAQPLRAQPLLQSEAAHGSGAGLVPRPGTPPREQVKGKKRGKRSKSGRQPKRRAATSGRNPSPPQRRGKHGPMLGPAGPFEPASFAPLPEAMITMLPCTPAKAAPSATLSYHAVPGGGPTSTESAPDLSQTMPPPRPPKVLQLRPLSTAPKAEPGALLHGSLRAVLGRPAAATHKAPEL
eukprot:TRINITY_DN15139_c0_g1_i3.p1 TRINITY_DN15139_c0_g1~~TRINITY_DN15139_c0_g1_i3.p1  ORF type:complete len:1134 (+),score=165.76 TRINITY_DN15139_c0_g1_i3:74-3475(+)